MIRDETLVPTSFGDRFLLYGDGVQSHAKVFYLASVTYRPKPILESCSCPFAGVHLYT